ncbi:hypothetical protein CR513_16781, partial [Mucuna pruriens]
MDPMSLDNAQLEKSRHMARDFQGPTNSKQTVNVIRDANPITIGKMFVVSRVEASGSQNVMLGECIIVDNLLYVLYDSYATHSIISYDYVNKLSLLTCLLFFDLLVSTPTTTLAITSSMCSNCPIIVYGCSYKANLICLPLFDLYVILGMDWLPSNHIPIDCARKTLIFSNPENMDLSLPTKQRLFQKKEPKDT